LRYHTAEILYGGRDANDRTKLITILDGFQQVAIPEPMWDEIGSVQAQLRAAGVTVPLVDAVLATIALSLDVERWARDATFSTSSECYQILNFLPKTRSLGNH
jgi:predicted nucleic acid-binding protein